MRRNLSLLLGLALVAANLIAMGGPALADHTNPRVPLSPTEPGEPGVPANVRGDGTWTFIRNFPANPGTDLEFFRRAGKTWSTSGTLGQADEDHVGQRILRLVKRDGSVAPRWSADHGSANCPTANPGGTLGLQHDAQVTPKKHPKFIIDTTDALGRCHDPNGGGLEIIHIRRITQRFAFMPREIHLTRHDGTTHNSTVDATRPYLVYNSDSDNKRNWIDVTNIKSCFGGTLEEKRDDCRPDVYRIPLQPKWTQQINHDPEDGPVGEREPGTETGCHDITARPGRLYCAAIEGTVILNVRNLTTDSGRVRGDPLPCRVRDGTRTHAKVTDCDLGDGTESADEDRALYKEAGRPRARGWNVVGWINHPGRETGNSNQLVNSDEGVAISHESDPVTVKGRKYLLVTDERGGGVVPPGASCTPGVENPTGNGGIHVFDITNPDNIRYARTPAGEKAVFISDPLTPAASFCNVHVIEKIPGEQRLIVAWYSQGFRIVDYFVNANGRWTFDEVAALQLPNANTWTVEDFKIKDNDDGTRTYFFMASDINRGIDIVKWRGPTNRSGERAAVAAAADTSGRGNLLLLVAGLVLLPAAATLGRVRRRGVTA